MRTHGYGGNPVENTRCRTVRGHHTTSEELVGIPFQVETKCSIIIPLFASHLHLHQMFTLKDVSLLIGEKDFFFGPGSWEFYVLSCLFLLPLL